MKNEIKTKQLLLSKIIEVGDDDEDENGEKIMEVSRLNLEDEKVEYRKYFNREVPDWKWEGMKTSQSMQNASEKLHDAREMGVPYYTKKEVAIRNGIENIETEYKKRFGKPITDFELSTMRVYFYHSEHEHPYILIARTPEGILAKYAFGNNYKKGLLEAKLDMGEWLDFIRALYKSIDEWEYRYSDTTDINIESDGIGSILSPRYWNLDIFILDNDNLEYSGGNVYPPNWDDFIKLMNDMEAKIKKNNQVSTKPKGGQVKFLNIDISDSSRSEIEIMKVVNFRRRSLENLYDRHLKLKPGFSGNVTIKFTIAPSGYITDISIVSSTTNYTEFDNVIKNIITTWKWKSINSGDTTISISLNFTKV